MRNIIVTGIGTDVGKTLVSAIIATRLKADYWKPIECGDSDTEQIRTLIDPSLHSLFPPAYRFKKPLSPHHAARLEQKEVDIGKINLPKSNRTLIVETAGGIFVPLTKEMLTLTAFKCWPADWIVVSRNYLGSINHTLLTVEALKKHGVSILGLVFNGDPNPDSEQVIEYQTQLPVIGRLKQELTWTLATTRHYATQFKLN